MAARQFAVARVHQVEPVAPHRPGIVRRKNRFRRRLFSPRSHHLKVVLGTVEQVQRPGILREEPGGGQGDGRVSFLGGVT